MTRQEEKKKKQKEKREGIKFLYFRNYEINAEKKKVPSCRGGVTLAIKETKENFEIAIVYCTIVDIFNRTYSINRAIDRLQIPDRSVDYMKYRYRCSKPQFSFGETMFQHLRDVVGNRICNFPTPVLIDLNGETT